jgi:hypothetical protein
LVDGAATSLDDAGKFDPDEARRSAGIQEVPDAGAAGAFVGVSADWLERAEDLGLDVAVLLAIAEQLIFGLSAS